MGVRWRARQARLGVRRGGADDARMGAREASKGRHTSKRAHNPGTCTAPWRTIAPHEAGMTSAMKVRQRAASSITSGLCSMPSSWTCAGGEEGDGFGGAGRGARGCSSPVVAKQCQNGGCASRQGARLPPTPALPRTSSGTTCSTGTVAARLSSWLMDSSSDSSDSVASSAPSSSYWRRPAMMPCGGGVGCEAWG